jgi:membrane-bound lytic murein transglycosylase D
MSKSKTITIIYFCCIVGLLFIAGCAGPAGDVATEPGDAGITPGAVELSNDAPQYIQRAEQLFHDGETHFENGDIREARSNFDRAVDLLLDSGAGAKTSLEQTHINDLIHRISEIELDYLEESAGENAGAHAAFIDEVVSTPLYTPSSIEIFRMREEMHRRKPAYSVPITVNSWVVSFIKAFRTVRRQNIQNALNRSVEYIDDFKRIFRSYDIPEDLAYLPVIESGFRVQALSRARARGVWQFMAATARMFGLRVDWVVDERRDPYKACHAAAKYLKQLHKKFGDWYLALACYNGGTRRVVRAIKRLKTKDFFKIARRRYLLRRETRNYVPAFLAALIIAKNPGAYGFKIEPAGTQLGDTKFIEIPSPVSLKQVAKTAAVSYAQLQKINPELIRDFTPFNKKYYSIRVPKNVDASSLEALKRLPPSDRYFVGWYRVKRGDSLYSIARKFNTSVRKIKRANKLRSNLIRPGKRLLIPRGG